jgi:hypothetical protein
MSEAENQVDLDFGDAQETEVTFPDTEESQGQSRAPEPSEADQEDNFSKAETATQKRINNLTKRMREAERQREEAIRYAQSVQSEAQQIRQRMDALDTNYVSEYTNRVQSQTEYAEKELARAIEMGDSQAVIEAQRKITSLAIESDRARQAQMQQERYRQQLQAQQAAQVQQPMPQQQPRRPDPKAETWASRNTWFGQDEAMTYAAFGIHKKLVEDEGFDPQSDDYYTELDQRIAAEFPHKLGAATKTEGNRRPAQTVAPASRGNSGRRSGKSVRLSPSQVAIAKKLGVPLEEYAKYVKE